MTKNYNVDTWIKFRNYYFLILPYFSQKSRNIFTEFYEIVIYETNKVKVNKMSTKRNIKVMDDFMNEHIINEIQDILKLT